MAICIMLRVFLGIHCVVPALLACIQFPAFEQWGLSSQDSWLASMFIYGQLQES